MGIEFTADQQKVIDTRNKNVLVSAAAGSGKTAVLVERIIQMITDANNPIDIDKLLVVTFTEAAAASMKDKIAQALDAKLSENPSDEHLQKQSSLLYKAQISTIHSFCLNIIRNNFNRIGLDPSFRVADETELTLMQEDVLNELFEEHYRFDANFSELIEYFCKVNSDRELREYVLKLYNFSQGYPWPDTFLNECLTEFDISNTGELENRNWMRFLRHYFDLITEDALLKIDEARGIAQKPYGPAAYLTTVESDAQNIKNLIACSTYEEIKEYMDNLKWAKLPPKTGEDTDEALKEEFKKKREVYKAMVKGNGSFSLSSFYYCDLKDEVEKINAIRPYIGALIALVKEFTAAYEAQRRSKGVISFNDMEHYALNILCAEGDDGHPILSETALEYQNEYAEILMDEYQDCNRVQELLMECVCSEKQGRFNRFMVGDVKQSIYKFRLANPQLFIDKYNSYCSDDLCGQDESNCVRINLKMNFRSRESVVNTVNDLFSQIMKPSLGGIDYNDDARLVLGADYPQYKDAGLDDLSRTELYFSVKNNDSNDDKLQEANLIANQIKYLMKHQLVTDSETKKLRPLRYKDTVILVRSMTDVAGCIKEVFTREGIPLFMNTNVGFYSTTEIQQVVQFLKIMDNPRQDIPMYGALHSFFGKFEDAEIAALKVDYAADCLYDSVCMAADSNAKAREFIELLQKYRKKAVYTPIRELLTSLTEETGYLEYVSAMAGGNQRRANVKMLISYAGDYENTSYKGLFHFVRYVKEVQKVESLIGEADILDENADVVRVMTIHKSKGLEFPVTILAGVHKQFNNSDTKGALTIDMDFGIGAGCINPSKRTKVTSLRQKVINLKIKQDMISEELRVLYVALTRAKEKLIITGTVKTPEPVLDGAMSYYDILSSASYLDMLRPLYPNAEYRGAESEEVARLDDNLSGMELKEEFMAKVRTVSESDELYRKLNERMNRTYRFSNLEGLVTKTSVSELKKAYLDTEFSESLFKERISLPYEPGFVKTECDGISGTDRGTAYHKVMELLDFGEKDIESQFNKMLEKHLISLRQIQAVPKRKIEEFMNSGLAKRMAKAQSEGTLKREQPFVLGIGADRINERYPDTKTVLLQGIIDAFFQEDGDIVLVDYKTDVVGSGDELMNRYRIQLKYYEEAIERITGMKVKESILYSFNLGTEVVKRF